MKLQKKRRTLSANASRSANVKHKQKKENKKA